MKREKHMRRGIFTLIAAVCLFGCASAYALDTNLAFRIGCEVQTAGMQSLPDLTWVQGSTPLIEFQPMRNGRQVALSTNVRARMLISSNLATASAWSVVTNTVLTTNAAASSLWCQWGAIGTNTAGTGTTAQAWGYLAFFEDGTGARYWNGSGRLYIEPSTSTDNGLTWQSATSYNAVAWGNVYGSVTDNAAIVAYIAASAGADTVARSGVVANAASIVAVGAVASNALPKSATNDLTLAYSAARGGFAGTETIAPQKIGLGTNSVFAIMPSATAARTNSAVSLQLRNGGILIQNDGRALATNAVTKLGYISLGYDQREFGRAGLWLNGYDYIVGTNRYDAGSDIMFGTGTNMDDASMRWSIASRPVNQGWGHDSSGALTIYEMYGAGASNIGGVRFGIYPDNGTNHGPVKIGNDSVLSYSGRPTEGETLVVIQNEPSYGPSSLCVESSTNPAANAISRIRLKAGTNSLYMAFVGTNNYFRVSRNADYSDQIAGIGADGSFYISSLALGTNAAVSDWPASGGGISASDAGQIATNVVAAYTNALPLPGCAILDVDPATSNAWIGASGLYGFYTVTNNTTPWNLCISNTQYRSPYGYGIKVVSTQAITAATNMVRVGPAPAALTATNLIAVWPHEDPAMWNYKIQAQ